MQCFSSSSSSLTLLVFSFLPVLPPVLSLRPSLCPRSRSRLQVQGHSVCPSACYHCSRPSRLQVRGHRAVVPHLQQQIMPYHAELHLGGLGRFDALAAPVEVVPVRALGEIVGDDGPVVVVGIVGGVVGWGGGMGEKGMGFSWLASIDACTHSLSQLSSPAQPRHESIDRCTHARTHSLSQLSRERMTRGHHGYVRHCSGLHMYVFGWVGGLVGRLVD